MINLIPAEELAARLGYSGVTSRFHDWCASLRITPVPGRRGYYDPALVRRRLDEAQGLVTPPSGEAEGRRSLVAARRARRGED